jgi:hypothetical protein
MRSGCRTITFGELYATPAADTDRGDCPTGEHGNRAANGC